MIVLLLAALQAPPDRSTVQPAAHAHQMASLVPSGEEAQRVLRVDSARGEAVLTVGPLHFDALPPGFDDGHQAPMVRTRMFRFDFPIDGFLTGCRLRLRDGAGRPLARDLMHFILVNYDRRQLAHGGAERLMGFARETEDVILPPGIGLPMQRGASLGLYAKRHYATPEAMDDVYIDLVLLWAPREQPLIAALPIYMDAALDVGGTNEFDVPPGRSEQGQEFTLPVGGHLFGVGGHMHQFGQRLRLEDAQDGHVLASLAAQRDSAGRVLDVERRVFGLTALRMEAGRRYRIVGEYDNPTAAPLRHFAMAHMVGVFIPDDASLVPALNLADPLVQRDLASLAREGDVMVTDVRQVVRPH